MVFRGFLKCSWRNLGKKLSRVPCIAVRAPCQSPVLPDQIVLDILCLEDAIFDTRFTCLKIADVTQDFWFSRVIWNLLKAQYKYKLANVSWRLAELQYASIWVEGKESLLFSQKFCCLAFILCGGLTHVFTCLTLVWLSQGDSHTFNELNEEKHLHHQLITWLT